MSNKKAAIIVSLIWFISCDGKDSAQNEKGVVTEVKQSHVMVKLPTVQCNTCKNTIETGLRNVNGILSVNADVESLKKFVAKINPTKIVPIHTFAKEKYQKIFTVPILEIDDKEEITVA